MARLRKYVRLLKQLNWFKMAADRTANGVKQQQIATRVYIILLAGMIIFIEHISAFVLH